jgi:F420-0:gamma-glutamyl ligase
LAALIAETLAADVLTAVANAVTGNGPEDTPALIVVFAAADVFTHE